MKKNLFFKLILACAITFLSFQNIRAQKTIYWNLAGNSNATSSSILGTTNATDLRIFSNNLERIRLTSAGLLGIGTTSPAYKLHVIGNALFTNGVTVSDGGISGYGTGTTAGVYGNSISGNGVFGSGNVGVGGSGNYGIYGVGTSYGVYASSSNTGVYGDGSVGVVGTGILSSSGIGVVGRGNTYGVFGHIDGATDALQATRAGVYGYNNNYGGGVYGYCVNGSGIIGYSVNYYAGWFSGNVNTTGNYYQSSDIILKTNISEFSNALHIINLLKPKTYQFRQDGKYKLMNLPTGNHYGIIAQDVEQILPYLVKDTKFDPRMAQPDVIDQATISSSNNISEAKESQKPSDETIKRNETIDFKAVNYTEFIPILIKGMQEQQEEIQQLKKQINDLKNTVTKFDPFQSQAIVSARLEQNEPNPSKNSTSINYSLPSRSNTAQLLVTDHLGRTIKTVRLNSSGIVNLDVSRLNNGIYNYSLVIDGKTVETKKMIVAKN